MKTIQGGTSIRHIGRSIFKNNSSGCSSDTDRSAFKAESRCLFQDLSDEEYRGALEAKHEEITAYILEQSEELSTLSRVAAKSEIRRLRDKDGRNKSGHQFVAGVMDQLLQKGWLVSAQTSHGEDRYRQKTRRLPTCDAGGRS